MFSLYAGKSEMGFAMGAILVNVGFALFKLAFFTFEERKQLSFYCKIFCVFSSAGKHVAGKKSEYSIPEK